MNILIPGGASYIGAYLVPHLLGDGHTVTVFDRLYFGSGFLPDNDHVKVVKGDIRDLEAWKAVCEGQDAVIYLASISRELLCERNKAVAHAINVAAFGPAVEAAKAAGVKRFIYASSVAVYGSSDHDAEETDPLEPTTIYGRGKMACENLLMASKSPEFCVTATRSASVCGYSPRMRFDLTINRMVHDAVRKGVITVEGGSQIRSHINMKDICEFYRLLLAAPDVKINAQAFNVVAENQTVMDSAKLVSDICNKPIEVKPRVDDRSYSIDGDKVLHVLGWKPSRRVSEAVLDLKVRLEDNYWSDSLTNPMYQNMSQEVIDERA